jgi:asparagine synthase (glutamine-hydrolysing)
VRYAIRRTPASWSGRSTEIVSESLATWKTRFNEAITDRDLCDGQREFEAYNIRSKEELLYLRKLTQTMDVSRVPHLRGRAWISFPVARYADQLAKYSHHVL